MTEYVVAIDVGTQSTRAALVDVEGIIHDVASSPIELYAPRPGWAEQDPEQWWETTVANIAAVIGRHPTATIGAIGVGAQMHSVVALSASGASLTDRAAIWSDKRCLDQVNAFERRADAEELSHLAGNRPLPAWAGFKMGWLRANAPEAYENAESLLVAKDFLNYRLCGEVATDPSEASGSFLCDAASGKWSDALVDALGVDAAKLPEIVDSWSVIGTVRKDVAGRTGVAEGTPVVAGSGDMMCQLLGSGITKPGRVGLVSGTASIMSLAAESASPDFRIMNLRSASGDWIRFGIEDAAGKSLRWFIDTVCPAGDPGQGRGSLESLVPQAALVEPGSGGLLFFPYLLGERTLGSPHSRASFVGATIGHERAHFVRAVMEGIALEDRRALECLCPAGVHGPIRASGGGASSSLWNQIRADVFAHPVQVLASAEGGIQGAAILAGVAAGWYSDAAAGAEEVIRVAETWTPSPDAVLVYEDAFRIFCAVHDALDGHWQAWDDRIKS
ncbi:MAG: FGGY family carbohydrate kinase [Acidimicrobiales bacterium]